MQRLSVKVCSLWNSDALSILTINVEVDCIVDRVSHSCWLWRIPPVVRMESYVTINVKFIDYCLPCITWPLLCYILSIPELPTCGCLCIRQRRSCASVINICCWGAGAMSTKQGYCTIMNPPTWKAASTVISRIFRILKLFVLGELLL